MGFKRRVLDALVSKEITPKEASEIIEIRRDHGTILKGHRTRKRAKIHQKVAKASRKGNR